MSLFYGYNKSDKKLDLSGGKMEGDLDMNDNQIKNIPLAVQPGDTVSKKFLENNFKKIQEMLENRLHGYSIIALTFEKIYERRVTRGWPVIHSLKSTDEIIININLITVDVDKTMNKTDFEFTVYFLGWLTDGTLVREIIIAVDNTTGTAIKTVDGSDPSVTIIPTVVKDWVISFPGKTMVGFIFGLQETRKAAILNGNEACIIWTAKSNINKVLVS